MYATTVQGVAGKVAQFGGTGALSALAPSTVATGTSSPSTVVLDGAGTQAFVLDNLDGVIALYSVGNGGVLSAMTPSTLTKSGPNGAAFDTTGPYFYVSSSDGAVTTYAVGATTVTRRCSPV